jgi:hypothetical protein
MVQLKGNYEMEIKQLQKEINVLLDRLDGKPKLATKPRRIQEHDETEIAKLLNDNSNLRAAV